MRILLVTSWDTPHHCGIEHHSRQLIAAVQAADPSIEIVPSAEALDPQHDEVRSSVVHDVGVSGIDLLHLNYHAALHSRWDVTAINRVNVPVLVTYHDTGVPNSDQCKAVIAAADAAVVHEPFDDLPAEKTHYWRQGVPEYSGHPWYSPHHLQAPIVGTVGHDFPWKNFDLLCELAESVGWGVLICTPSMSAARQAELHAKNRRLSIQVNQSDEMVLAMLRGCDATACLYVNANTGTSAAIRQCIAAKKPVLAFSPQAGGRQFRDLYDMPVIRWCHSVEDVSQHLRTLPLGCFDPGIVALAEQDSGRHLGQKYAALYRALVTA